jgi:hypothetical protein
VAWRGSCGLAAGGADGYSKFLGKNAQQMRTIFYFILSLFRASLAQNHGALRGPQAPHFFRPVPPPHSPFVRGNTHAGNAQRPGLFFELLGSLFTTRLTIYNNGACGDGENYVTSFSDGACAVISPPFAQATPPLAAFCRGPWSGKAFPCPPRT